ncbi:MAG: hypothetical protein IJN65_05610 [Clostridia bacterium]|nr:hypothetical protein [Clostridia bacterium]
MQYVDFKNDILSLLNMASIPLNEFKVLEHPNKEDGLYFEKRGNLYIYGYCERGNKQIKCQTENICELEYYVLKDIVVNFSIDYEIKNRVWYKDSRRIWMNVALKYIGKIDKDYYDALKKEFDEILVLAPYDDFCCVQVNILKRLYNVLNQEKIGYNLANMQLKRKIKKIKAQIKKASDADLLVDLSVISNLVLQTKDLYNYVSSNKDLRFVGKEFLDELEIIVREGTILTASNTRDGGNTGDARSGDGSVC